MRSDTDMLLGLQESHTVLSLVKKDVLAVVTSKKNFDRQEWYERRSPSSCYFLHVFLAALNFDRCAIVYPTTKVQGKKSLLV